MESAKLIRRLRFSARHHYHRADLSDEENRNLFGDQVVPHEHDWLIEVEVSGPIDDGTGFVTDLVQLDTCLAGVVDGWDGGDLNELVPEVRDGSMQPSTECLARWIFQALDRAFPGPARLNTVRVWESEALGAAYPAD